MLSIIQLIDVDEYMYIPQEDLEETIETLNVLNIAYEVYTVQDKMYRITWYDYIDETWNEIWCTPEKFEEKLALVLEAEVEYVVNEYN
jgi:hypothetical protein